MGSGERLNLECRCITVWRNEIKQVYPPEPVVKSFYGYNYSRPITGRDGIAGQSVFEPRQE